MPNRPPLGSCPPSRWRARSPSERVGPTTNSDAPTAASAAEGTGPPIDHGLVRGGVRYAIGAVLVTLAALWFLDTQRSLVGYLIIAGLIALALEPAVIWFREKHGWRRGSRTACCWWVCCWSGTGVGLIAATRGTRRSSASFPSYVDKINAFTRDRFDATVVSASQRLAAANAATRVEDLRAPGGRPRRDRVRGERDLLGYRRLFTFYMTAQGPQMQRALLSRMPPERQQRVLFAWETAIKRMGGYLYSRLLLAVINGVLMYITLKVLGVPYALPLAMLSAFIASSSRSSGRTSEAPSRSWSPWPSGDPPRRSSC